MPAPAVYVLAVVGTIGAAYAFHQFVYEPHIAPKIEVWAEEFIARRRARRMQQQGPIPVPASIPLRRRRRREGRRGSKNSDSTLSDSEPNSDSDPDTGRGGPSAQRSRGSRQPSSSFTSAYGVDFDSGVAREVSEWRSEVSRSQMSNNLRHRTNHVMDESINPIPHPTMSPTHVIFDTSGPTTPTTTTVPSIISSPPAQVSPLLTATTESTLHASPNRAPAPLRPSHLSQTRAPLPSSPSPTAQTNRAPAGPVYRIATSPVLDTYTPPSFSSPIPSLSQSYPQELDRERDVELLSRPSSGTSSPFTTFSPLVASQTLSPSAVVQPLDRNPSSPRSPNPASRSSSPSQHTVTDAEYHSLPASPTSLPSELSSPVHITHGPIRSPSPQEDPLHPELINFTSPNAISPRSPHSDLSELELESDFDVVSDPGSE